MKSEGLKDALNAIIEQQQELHRNATQIRESLFKALIEESPIKKGDKVSVFNRQWGSKEEKEVGKGIVTGFALDRMKLVFVIAKVKKNGNPSLNTWSKLDFSRVEKIEQ